MTAIAERTVAGRAAEMELATFYVGDLLLGVDLQQVREINRLLDYTPVPQAPDYVRGVINLRGEVVTVVDLRTILGLGQTTVGKSTRNVIVQSGGEVVGMLVDQVADTVRVQADQIDPPPPNVQGADCRFFPGVHRLENQLVVLLDVNAALASDQHSQ
jgi:purine-binding chemotaxis protein CheW